MSNQLNMIIMKTLCDIITDIKNRYKGFFLIRGKKSMNLCIYICIDTNTIEHKGEYKYKETKIDSLSFEFLLKEIISATE